MKSRSYFRKTPEQSARARQNRHVVFLLVFVLFGALFSWRPCNEAILEAVLPEEALVRTSHTWLSDGVYRAVRHDMLLTVADGAGCENVEYWKDDIDGLYQTLRWLTGSKTTLALTLRDEAGCPSFDELDPLGSLQALFAGDPLEVLPRMCLSGASYVGWKRRPMELLWRLKYVPGLGKLQTTERGTRYLEFENSKTMRRSGLVLSLDLFEGHLLATLSTDPDGVLPLVERAKTISQSKAQASRAWPAIHHNITLLPKGSHPITLSFDTLDNPQELPFRVSFGEMADIDNQLLTWRHLYFVHSPHDFAHVEYRATPTSTPASVHLYKNPGSTFCGFTIPGAVAFLPPDGPSPHELVNDLFAKAFAPDAKRPEIVSREGALSQIDFRPLFGKHAFIKPVLDEEPFFIQSSSSNEVSVLGTCLSSYQALMAIPDVSFIRSLHEMPEDIIAVGGYSPKETADAFRNVTAILQLAGSFNSNLASLRPTLTLINRILDSGEEAISEISFFLNRNNVLDVNLLSRHKE